MSGSSVPLPSAPPRPARTFAAAAALVLAVLLVYWNSKDAPFVFDDRPAILQNPSIRALWPLSIPLKPPVTAGGVTGRPVVNLSFALNYAWGEEQVRGYRLTNIALHALVALTLWGVVRRTLLSLYSPRSTDAAHPSCRHFTASAAETIAWYATALWAVHPLLTESVACVVQRNEILGGLFYLLTLYTFIRGAQTAAPARRCAWLIAAAASCWLGIATKEIVATAPLAVWLYDRTFVAGTFRSAFRTRSGFYLVLAGSWALLGWLMLGGHQRGGTVGFGLGVSAWDYLLTQCRALVLYAKLSVWPYPLILDYGMQIDRDLHEVWWRGLLVLGGLAVTLWAIVLRPRVGFVAACCFIILAPSSSFVPLVSQTIAEHRMYLPLAALLVLGVLGLHCIAGAATRVGVILLAVAYGWLTVQRNEIFHDEPRLWSEIIARVPDNPRAHVNFGHYHAQREDWDAALQHHRAALELRPAYADARNGLGQALSHLGREEEALAEFAAAHALSPNDALINFNYGTALAKAGRLPEGIDRLEHSLRVNPGFADVFNNLGLALALAARSDDALAQLRAGVDAHPRHAKLRVNLANQLFARGAFAEAAREYRVATELEPSLVGAHFNLALALRRLDRSAEAIPHFERAIALSPGSAETHAQLAYALAAVGRTAEAIAHADVALRSDAGHAGARQLLDDLSAR